MESEIAGSSSGAVMRDVTNFGRTEMVVDNVNSPVFQNFLAYEESNKNVAFLPNSTDEKKNSSTCVDENLSEGYKKEESSGVYLSTGIYIHPITLNGNYENIIELIDVDPNDKLDAVSPTKKTSKPNKVDASDRYDVAFGRLVPFNNSVIPYIHNYAKIPASNELHTQQAVYDTSNDSESEKVNPFLPIETKKAVPPFLRRNRKPKTAPLESEPTKTEPNHLEDDDVVFVKAWCLPPNVEEPNASSQITSAEIADTNVEATSSTSSPAVTIRRRRRRRTVSEKRKNPVRKAQIDKASIDLVEKLAIPASVFNARVKGRKPKQKIVVETKNLRQSCRTTGAILSPPRTITQYDFKDWPADGMHERPFYDESTNTIIKYHIPSDGVDNQQRADRRPVLSELQFCEPETPPKFDNTVQNSLKRNTFDSIRHSKKFARLSLDRLQMMFGYVQELKQFNRLVAANQEKQCPKKTTLYEKSLEFRLYQNGIKQNKFEKSFSQMIKGCKEENIKNVQAMLHDTCTLYSLASGVSGKDVAGMVKRFAAEGKKWVRPQI